MAKKRKNIYMDYASTTPVDNFVARAMKPYFGDVFANPSSIHIHGRLAKQALDKARKDVSKVLCSEPESIYFTSGGTESNNIAILGFARACQEAKISGTFLCSEIEHHAVLDTVKAVKQYGLEYEYLPVTSDGILNMQALELRLKKGDVRLISVMYANNEIGTIQPIRKIAGLCHKYGAVFHTDACQAPLFLEMNTRKLGVDMMTINGSKIYGPKGVGALFVKKGIKLLPITYGGGQEAGLRSGTENVPGIVGLTRAIMLTTKRRCKDNENIKSLRDMLIAGLLKIPNAHLNGSRTSRLPNNVNISFEGIEGETLMLYLDHLGVSVASGSACSTKSVEPSHVITALYKNDKNKAYLRAHGSIRLTLGRKSTIREVDRAVNMFKRGVAKLSKLSAISLNNKIDR